MIPTIYLSPEDIYHLFEMSIMVGLVYFLYLIFFIAFWEYKGMYQKMGLDPRIVYLILIGGIMGTLANVPILGGGGNLLAINIGGAIIPVFVSLYLAIKKEFNPVIYITGCAIVAALAYSTTRIIYNLGIVATFPTLFIPPLTASAIALVVYRRKLEYAAPFAYGISTLGVLFGADLLRIPEIMNMGQGFFGSIGGAGFVDMVFLAGLLSFTVLLPFSTHKLRSQNEVFDTGLRRELWMRHNLASGHINLIKGRFGAALESYMDALHAYIEELALLYGINVDYNATPMERYTSILKDLNINSNLLDDYLKIYSVKKSAGFIDLMRCIFTIKVIMKQLQAYEERTIAPISKRIVAYMIDSGIVVLITLLIVMPPLLATHYSTSTIVLVLLSSRFVIEIFYFTIFEYMYAFTIGKRIMGLKVVTLDRRPLPFMSAFARNVFRGLDYILLFYFISLVVMLKDNKRRRLGDFLAYTMVVMDPQPMWEAYNTSLRYMYPYRYNPPYTPPIMPRS